MEGRGSGEGARAHCERGCIGCLNSSKSRGSAVCVWCHALEGGAEDGGRRTEREADEGVEGYMLTKYVCVPTCCGW